MGWEQDARGSKDFTKQFFVVGRIKKEETNVTHLQLNLILLE